MISKTYATINNVILQQFDFQMAFDSVLFNNYTEKDNESSKNKLILVENYFLIFE